MSNEKPCKRCGKCCCGLIVDITPGDLYRWYMECEDRIMQYLSPVSDLVVDAWISPETGEEMHRCPFLRKVRGQQIYKCTINHTKPWACRVYTPGECIGYAEERKAKKCLTSKLLSALFKKSKKGSGVPFLISRKKHS